jgi:hypothetical protein
MPNVRDLSNFRSSRVGLSGTSTRRVGQILPDAAGLRFDAILAVAVLEAGTSARRFSAESQFLNP